MITQTPTHISLTLFRGWVVTASSSFMGLFLGILYVWSVIKSGIPDSWGWTYADKALPYSVMCITFSVIMVPAGLLQDRFGPRWVVLLGGFLTGLGCIMSGLGGGARLAYVIGFGLVTGSGAGFAYSALTPAAIKWFPPQRTGVVVGIVVAGFGLSPLPLAPLATWLLSCFKTTTTFGVVEKGISQTMIGLGLAIWLVVGLLFWFIDNPPAGFSAAPRKSADPVSQRPESRTGGRCSPLLNSGFYS